MTQNEALTWLARLFEEPAPALLKPETPREEIAAWDSLGLLTLMAELDEKFNIQLEADDMEAMTSVQDVLDVLKRNGALSA
jgi:acyl carrier protein